MPSTRRGVHGAPQSSGPASGADPLNLKAASASPQVTRAKRLAPSPPSSRRSDHGHAFFPDPQDGPARAPDDFAEGLAEGFLASAIAGESWEQPEDDLYDEENGGPFVLSSNRKELSRQGAEGEDFESEPFPTSSAPPSVWPADAKEESEEEE